MDLSVFFAGTAGSVPTQRRGLPAYLLRAGGDRILFDCGEGTQRQLLKTVGLPELDAIFLTHFHLDHWLGVVGVVKTFDLRGRERPLTIYGPPGMRQTFAMIRALVGRTAYPISYVELDPHEEVGFDDYVIAAFPVRHRVDAFGYAFIEDDRPGHFDVAAARALGVTEGPDFGRLQRGETVNGVRPEQVTGDPRPGRVIVYSGDTQPVHTVEEYARDASLLIHEATFLEDEHAAPATRGTRPRARPRGWPATPASRCSPSRISPPATSSAMFWPRRRGYSRTRWYRRTSRSSRSRSRSAASRA